jgi:RNA polymerase sigma-70 factor (ECF subfamily)
MLRRAHADSEMSAAEARRILVLRYSPAIRGYVRALARDDETADELAQDFMVRMLRGDFAGADPNRGRFRDLLKTAIRNMVRNHWEKQRRRRPADFDVAELGQDDAPEDADPWLENWRRNLLEVAWSRLEEHQNEHPGSTVHTILKLRADYPEDDSKQLAERLTATLGRPIKPEAVRQQLHRARVRLAEFLVEEVADAIDQPVGERIQDELIALGLYEHIRDVLPKEWAN